MRIREVRQKAQTEQANIKAEEGDRGAEDGDRSDLATIMLSDGGFANPAFPSHDGIAPCGPSVSYRNAYSHTYSDTHSIPDSPPDSDSYSLPNSGITLIMILMEISYLAKCLLLLNS